MEQITKYPLFGKIALVKDDVMQEVGYREPGSNCIMHPALRGAPVTTEATIYTDVRVRTFSTGSEFMGWTCRNCELCAKYKNDIAEPTDIRNGGCSLELRLAIAYMDDGKIPFKTAKRIGFTYLSISRNGVFARLGNCKEFVAKETHPV